MPLLTVIASAPAYIGRAYRAGDWSMPAAATLDDLIAYECDELGNRVTLHADAYDATEDVPAGDLRWVAFDPAVALSYSCKRPYWTPITDLIPTPEEIDEFTVTFEPPARIISLDDGEGGYLVVLHPERYGL